MDKTKKEGNMKRLKILAVVLALMVGLCVFSGCSDKPPYKIQQEGEFTPHMGELYLLEDAYEEGYITKKDLKMIAYYLNNDKEYPNPLREEVTVCIKETAAEELRNDDVPDAEAKDITILNYLGFYSGCYAVILRDIYTLEPAMPIETWDIIDGVKFHYYGYHKIEIWK